MADEEVDWGFDDSVDVWRQSGQGDALADEDDVISLDGEEQEEVVQPKSKGRTSSSNKAAPTAPSSKLAPTGPKRESSKSSATNGASNVPTGPRKPASFSKSQDQSSSVLVNTDSRSNGRQPNSKAAPVGNVVAGTPDQPSTASMPTQPNSATSAAPSAPADEEESLPEGWTRVMSQSQGKYFYHNTATKQTSWVQTSWVRPTAVNRVMTPPPDDMEVDVDVETTEAALTTKKDLKDRLGVSESAEVEAKDNLQKVADDPITSTSPIERKLSGQPPSGPKQVDRGDFNNDRRRARSPSPRGRNDDYKRYRVDNDSYRRNQNTNTDRNAPPSGPRSGNANERFDNGYSRRNDNYNNNNPNGGRGGYHRNFQKDDHRRGYDSQGRSPPKDNRTQHLASSAQPYRVDGGNNAPLTKNRWGNKSDSNSGNATPVLEKSNEKSSALEPVGSSTAPIVIDDEAADRRAKLREEARKAEEALKRIKEEEERLEREEAEQRQTKSASAELSDAIQKSVTERITYKDMPPPRVETVGNKLNFVPRGRDVRGLKPGEGPGVAPAQPFKTAPIRMGLDDPKPRRPTSPSRTPSHGRATFVPDPNKLPPQGLPEEFIRRSAPPHGQDRREHRDDRNDRNRYQRDDRPRDDRPRKQYSPGAAGRRTTPPPPTAESMRPFIARDPSSATHRSDTHRPTGRGSPPPASLASRMNRRPPPNDFAEPMSSQAQRAHQNANRKSPPPVHRRESDRDQPRSNRPFAERIAGAAPMRDDRRGEQNQTGRRL